MTDSRFYRKKGPLSVEACASHLGLEFQGDGSRLIHDVAPLEEAGPDEAAFCLKVADLKPVGLLVIPHELASHIPSGTSALLANNPYQAFTHLVEFLLDIHQEEFSSSSLLSSSADIASGAHISPTCVVGPDVVVEEGCWIGPHVSIGRGCVIGARSVIHAGCHITKSVLGKGVSLLPGCVIGYPGFGFAHREGGWIDFPHVGRVIVEDDVKIGANSTIARGALGDTIIGSHTRLDSLIQIAHNVKIGSYCIMAAQVGVAGSSEIGEGSALGGQVGISDHVRLGKKVRVAAQSGVMRPVEDNTTIAGYPAVPIMDWRRQTLILNQLIKKKTS